MMALLPVLSVSAEAASHAERLVTCQFGRVTGADAQNKAIIEGNYRLSALVHGDNALELVDPTPLLPHASGSPITAVDSGDGKLSFKGVSAGGWMPVAAIDPAMGGSAERTAVVLRLGQPAGTFDQSWFFYGHCTVDAGEGVSKKFRTVQ
jgi:hypothetical protein